MSQERPPTPDPAAVESILRQLKAIVPAAFSEGRFDPHALAEILGLAHPNPHESYRLRWPGKDQALEPLRNPTPIALDPKPQHSLQFHQAPHALVVGENLTTLLAIAHNYHRAVKMIYLDPPYNTGNDRFVYPDQFHDAPEIHQQKTGQRDNRGLRIRYLKNTPDNGRFHSNWLNFLYPRLFLARDLLQDDGLIFVSIDEHEIHNLRHLLDEIFGEENFVGELVRKTKSTTNDSKTGFNLQHESVLVYAKNIDHAQVFGGEKDLSRYDNPDNDPNGPWTSSDPTAKTGSEKMRYEIVNPHTGTSDWPPEGRYWQFSREGFEERVKSGQIVFKKTVRPGERGFVFKRYLRQLRTTRRTLDSLAFTDNEYMNQHATKAWLEFMGIDAFTYPKGVNFLKRLIEHGTNRDTEDVVMDFFAGSGTTGHAVMELNFEDGGNRRCVLVQAPEANGELAGGYEHLGQVCAARLRRAGEKYQTGFRYFEASPSHLKPWIAPADAQEAEKVLELFADGAAPGTEPADLAWELAMKSGARPTLDAPWEERTLEGATIYRHGGATVVLAPPTGDAEAFWEHALQNTHTLVLWDPVFGDDDAGMTNLAMECATRGIRLETP